MKNCTFFTSDEDLLSVISAKLQEDDRFVREIHSLPIAWTNIVFDVLCSRGERFIFRFPRNQFFSNKIVVDMEACKFLKKNTPFQYVDICLCFDTKGRPYTVHKKVEGVGLFERIDYLNAKKKDEVAKYVANFLNTLHSLKIQPEHPQILQTKTSDFLDELAKVDDDFYDYTMHNIVKAEESKELVYVHGDLNIRNILLDKKDNIKCFLDYTFFGLSSRYTDLARMNSKVEKSFLNKILFYYEKMSGFNIRADIFGKFVETWEYIEQEYINYIHNYHKDIHLV
jgi:aminoglycoside phosphotransferase (APT) family kinase protein